MKRLIFSLLYVLSARPVSAQTGAIVSYTLDVYKPGNDPLVGLPDKSVTMLVAGPAIRCGQPLFPTPPPTPPFVPKTVVWTDPADATKDCLSDQTLFFQGLPALPAGQTYVATLTATNDFGATSTSARSNVSNPFPAALAPFKPSAPTGLQVR